METILQMIQIFLDDENPDAFGFSIQLEDMLYDYYDEMKNENLAVTEILNEELPDICASYEQGVDLKKFKEQIRREYMRAVEWM